MKKKFHYLLIIMIFWGCFNAALSCSVSIYNEIWEIKTELGVSVTYRGRNRFDFNDLISIPPLTPKTSGIPSIEIPRERIERIIFTLHDNKYAFETCFEKALLDITIFKPKISLIKNLEVHLINKAIVVEVLYQGPPLFLSESE